MLLQEETYPVLFQHLEMCQSCYTHQPTVPHNSGTVQITNVNLLQLMLSNVSSHLPHIHVTSDQFNRSHVQMLRVCHISSRCACRSAQTSSPPTLRCSCSTNSARLTGNITDSSVSLALITLTRYQY